MSEFILWLSFVFVAILKILLDKHKQKENITHECKGTTIRVWLFQDIKMYLSRTRF